MSRTTTHNWLFNTLLLGIAATLFAGCAAGPTTRINAGADKPITDALGNAWLADSGFVGGSTVDRGNIKIENTKIPEIYRTEHWGMTAFAYKVPNGKYAVKLHFAETYEGVTAAGQRLFTLSVEGKEIKDLDVFKEAGGANKAFVKPVDVAVNDGELNITFKEGEQNPEINGIEIIPR